VDDREETGTNRAHAIGNEFGASSSREEGRPSHPIADRARFPFIEAHTREPPRRAISPPRVPYSLPTPDFSPIFDPLSENMDTNPSLPAQPDANTSTRPWLNDTNARTSTTSGMRPQRQISPTRSTLSQHPVQNQASTYRNINLNAFHDGSFRTSLQRFIELDRVRSRLTRLETMANEAPPTPSSAPFLPPLRFDSESLPLSGGASQAGAAPMSTVSPLSLA
jgi:hypothetical protein